MTAARDLDLMEELRAEPAETPPEFFDRVLTDREERRRETAICVCFSDLCGRVEAGGFLDRVLIEAGLHRKHVPNASQATIRPASGLLRSVMILA